MSPISSRNKVPPLANSNFPFLSLIADVNAPFSCPNNSLSINSEGIAAQLTSINAIFLRFELSCKERATNSFPVPFPPVIKTRASEGATFSIMSLIFTIPSVSPIIDDPLNFLTVDFKDFVSSTKNNRSLAFRMVTKMRFKSNGFSIKSKAPFLIASTAVSIFP